MKEAPGAVQKVELHVESSSGGKGYQVVFVIQGDGTLSAGCDCPAGSNNTLCKHLLSIIKGDYSILKKPRSGFNEKESVQKAQEWTRQYGLADMVQEFEARLAEIEQEKKRLQTQVKREKKALLRRLGSATPQ